MYPHLIFTSLEGEHPLLDFLIPCPMIMPLCQEHIYILLSTAKENCPRALIRILRQENCHGLPGWTECSPKGPWNTEEGNRRFRDATVETDLILLWLSTLMMKGKAPGGKMQSPPETGTHQNKQTSKTKQWNTRFFPQGIISNVALSILISFQENPGYIPVLQKGALVYLYCFKLLNVWWFVMIATGSSRKFLSPWTPLLFWFSLYNCAESLLKR